MSGWSWREGFRFALARELLSDDKLAVTYEMNRAEKFGSRFLKPLNQLINFLSKNIRLPLAIVFFTLMAALFAVIVFYNIPAFEILGRLFPSNLVRGLLFFYVEMNIFAMGCRAFGRFNNSVLVEQWKSGHLVPVFPGDWKTKK